MNIIRSEIKNELYTVAVKTLASIAIGPFLTEAIFELRSNLKQKRVNDFVESLAKHLEIAHTLDIEQSPLGTEAFSDIWENVLLKISKTRSQKKVEIFRNLLLNHILTDSDPDLLEMYLEIIERINEKQILILNGLEQGYGGVFIYLHEKLHDIKSEIKTLQAESEREQGTSEGIERSWTKDRIVDARRKEQQKLLIEIQNASEWYKSATYNCEPDEFHFLVQDLCSKGLVVDMGSKFNADPFTLIEISSMGRNILEFLASPEAEQS